MARFGCRCGNALSSTNVPSPNILHVYKTEDVEKVLLKDPDKLLIDFQTDYEGSEYWYCPNCKRVYEVEAKPQGQATAVYHLSEDERTSDLSSLSAWYVLTDKEMYDSEEENYKLTVKDFFDSLTQSSVYYADVYNNHVYHIDESDKMPHMVYEKEV